MANAQVNEKNCKMVTDENGMKNAFEFFTGIKIEMKMRKRILE